MLLTVQNVVLNIIPPELSGLVIGTNILLWVFTSFIDDDNSLKLSPVSHLKNQLGFFARRVFKGANLSSVKSNFTPKFTATLNPNP